MENVAENDNENVHYVGRQIMPRGGSRQDFRTPPEVFKYASERWGPFTLDAAASAENALHTEYLSDSEDECKNGLTALWYSEFSAKSTVWCNPPYTRGVIEKFIDKALSEVEKGVADRVVLLLPVRVDVKWWRRLVDHPLTSFTFLTGRLNFLGPNSCSDPSPKRVSSPVGSVFVVINSHHALHPIYEWIDRPEAVE